MYLEYGVVVRNGVHCRALGTTAAKLGLREQDDSSTSSAAVSFSRILHLHSMC
jgi:hypothetical protein